jgi:hypothetical protein
MTTASATPVARVSPSPQEFTAKGPAEREQELALIGGSMKQHRSEQIVGPTTHAYTAVTTNPLWNHTLLQHNWLITSPYAEARHQLNLSSLETQDQLMSLILTLLIAVRNDYATCRYEDAFDWRMLMNSLKTLADSEGVRWKRREYYVVEFRSKLKEDIDVDLLYRLDKESHGEAAQSGGLLKYWYGKPDVERRNLATCEPPYCVIWEIADSI